LSSKKFHLNEVRIDRSTLDKLPILVAEGLGLSQRHAFLLQRKITQSLQIPVISHGKSLAIVPINNLNPGEYWAFLEDEGIKGFTKLSTTFGRQTFRIKRRLMGAILNYSHEKSNIFQQGFLDFYEYDPDISIFYSSVSIVVLEEDEYYRLFLEPGYNAIYPFSSLSTESIQRGGLRALETPPYGGFLGFLVGVEDATTVNQEEEFILIEVQKGETVDQYIRLKRTGRSMTSYLVPSQLVLIRPSYEILAENDHLEILRKKTLVSPSNRLQHMSDWYNKLFPDNELSVGNTFKAATWVEFGFTEPVDYTGQQTEDVPALYYQENPLRFGPTQPENLDLFDPYNGLRNYGPWDLRLKDQSRFVDSIHPYIIRPKDNPLGWRIYHLLQFFTKGGYADELKASHYDRSFRGFEREFRIKFEEPNKEDGVPDCETDEDYLAAADQVIEKWSASNGDPSRIVLVAFPFDQEDDLEDTVFSKRLYPQLKQKFIQAGLPSQMIDRSTLETIQFQGSHLGRQTNLYFNNPYFGHILWNLALNIYVKMGGRPWTLQRKLDNVNCLIGLSFTVNTLHPERPLYVGVANIFDEYGEWVDIAPEQRQLSDEELKAWYESPYSFYSQETTSSKLPREFTAEIIRASINLYKNRRGNDPVNIVMHKTGMIYQAEIEGILLGIKNAGLSLSEITIGFVSLVQNHGFRMYGEPNSNSRKNSVVHRGTMCTLEIDKALLATTGRTDRSDHILGTPQPLEIRVERPSPETLESVGLDRIKQYSVAQLCEQLMALTQLHWGTMRREIKLPVTVLYSQKVASLSARAEIRALPEGRLHRPWFI
jgi:hypothetical protein